MPKVIILDTNFLMIPFQFKVDIFAEIARICNFSYNLAALDRTVQELESITKGRHKTSAALALQLLKKKDLKIIRTQSKKPVDDLIVEHAKKGAIIASQDAELRGRVKNNGSRIIFLRNKKFLKLE